MKLIIIWCVVLSSSIAAMNGDKSFIRIQLDPMRSLYPKCIQGFQPYDEKRSMYMSMNNRIVDYFKKNIEKNNRNKWLWYALFSTPDVLEKINKHMDEHKKLLHNRREMLKELCIRHAFDIIKKHKQARAPQAGIHSGAAAQFTSITATASSLEA